ncbi:MULTISPECIES: HD domain-containing protein [unclassified Burkholderia]|uniref:HD domain-containing protein n=1 Tax=unclassified Burkholderia TaxID=2613784 RepID=UPI000B7AAA7F|nr:MULTISPECIES: HD domain-containing protein [unclassified Burkholderia]MDN7489026.1 HD domain-containing protein [Burkholderia sp. AU45274]OXJ07595.1 phosphohydrolase [Burkholderia sp. HI2500]
MTFPAFAPFQDLANTLLAHWRDANGDGAHDTSHLQRVWKNAAAIQAKEGGDAEVLLAATLLHDCVAVEKDSPLRAHASRLSAEKARQVLKSLDWPDAKIDAVAHAVEAHSFSAGVAPKTIEAKVLQDADRLDAIGMVGVARCFYVAGRMGSALYDPADPHASARALDDTRFAIDHFRTKLLRLSTGFQTVTGTRMAIVRRDRLQRFLDEFSDEI